MQKEQEVWIARPGDLITGSVEELATRVGGLPLWPPGCTVPTPQQTTCRACGQQLALILQAHAPLEAHQLAGDAAQPRRFLFLFGCTAEGCGKQPGSWRALRLTQLAASSVGSSEAPSSASAPEPPAAAPPAAAPPPPAAADDWGVGGADDWGVGGADDWSTDAAPASGTEATSPFDFGDLNAALEAVGAAPAPAKAAAGGRQRQAAGSGQPGGSAAGPAYSAARASLPAFYLWAEPESQCAGGGGGSKREQEHLQALLARYEQEAAAAGEAAEASAAACAPSVEGGPEAWGGEAYEEDAVLGPAGGKKAGVGAAFFKFSKQLARCPDQCARYSFGGGPLWPSSTPPPAPQPCGACGAARVFELQLMTPLIPALVESAEWLAAGSGGGGAAAGATLAPPDSWEWLTVCVYVCGASCCGSAGAAALVEELAVLANEED